MERRKDGRGGRRVREEGRGGERREGEKGREEGQFMLIVFISSMKSQNALSI